MVTANLLALVAAAHQTGGQVICIAPTRIELQSSKHALKSDASFVKFVIGNPHDLLLNECKEADFFLIDCGLEDYEGIMRGLVHARKGDEKRGVMVGFNAFCKGSTWQWGGLGTHLLPIGDGLLVTKMGGCCGNVKRGKDLVRKSNWVVKIDKCTGEEHVFRVRSPQKKLEIAV